jgi:hypothetical protein
MVSFGIGSCFAIHIWAIALPNVDFTEWISRPAGYLPRRQMFPLSYFISCQVTVSYITGGVTVLTVAAGWTVRASK